VRFAGRGAASCATPRHECLLIESSGSNVNSELAVALGVADEAGRRRVCLCPLWVKSGLNAAQNDMSALHPKTDMVSAVAHVCFGPKADILREGASLDFSFLGSFKSRRAGSKLGSH